MIVNVTELNRGDILEIDGDPWQVTEISSQTPSARGAAMIVKAKLKNLRSGQSLARTWRGGETVSEVSVPAEGAITVPPLTLDGSRFKRAPHKNKFGKDYAAGEPY